MGPVGVESTRHEKINVKFEPLNLQFKKLQSSAYLCGMGIYKQTEREGQKQVRINLDRGT